MEVRDDGDSRKPLEAAMGVVGVCGSEPGIGRFFDSAISEGKAINAQSDDTCEFNWLQILCGPNKESHC